MRLDSWRTRIGRDCLRAVALFCLSALRSEVANAQGASLPGQGTLAPRIPLAAPTTPRSGDTTGYWQQRADYVLIATLDERLGGIRASGRLRYVNHSPDILRELWVHQHLNAFRPGSRWSATDEREGRQRFQKLREPDFAYERFTAPPSVGGRALVAEYPLAPDSSIVRLALPSPLRPGDSVTVQFAWEARPSTVPRRQARRGRSYDFSQWFPKVAVYDRTGWHPNALVPAGEFYGEFGAFDVTLVLPNDQVVGATGVPVSGDPGWARAAVRGTAAPRLAATAYRNVAPAPTVDVPSGYRAVRFIARDVHHFAWSVSPGFRYEGGTYVRAPVQEWRFPIWDTVSVHTLYRADATDDCGRAYLSIYNDSVRYEQSVAECVAVSRTQWEGGKALRYAMQSLRWLEALYGDYPYPQLTILKRIDGGGTEFPMLVENGSASLDLTLHEVGHIYTFGILANNEWQSAWMDEGLTSYQTSLQNGESRVLLAARLAAANERDPAHSTDSALARLRVTLDSATATQSRLVRAGAAEPIGTRADLFQSFSTYNAMVYDRASLMYQALHDVLGEEDFQSFMREYFARWQFRHVDRWAMQASAERISRKPLGWFFDQWVNRVAEIDYTLRGAVVARAGDGWMVTATLMRSAGAYRHPMPVGVRTSVGWTLLRANPALDVQTVRIRVSEKPDAIWLDPFGSTDSPTASYYRLPLSAR